jgi:hypothetical protein
MVTHVMAAIALSPGILEKLESKRRAFLWSGKSKTKGGLLSGRMGHSLEAVL